MVTDVPVPPADDLLLGAADRRRVWERSGEILHDYVERVTEARVTPDPGLTSTQIRDSLERVGLDGVDPLDVLTFVADGLWRGQVHTPHPRYFGLFNPAPTTMSIVADAMVAGFNPQLAAASHSPFAAEVEHFVIQEFGTRLGYDREHLDGTFTSGGAEANHTALLTALTRRFPDFGRGGARALPGLPTIYVSSESHHSFVKAARMSGLGTDAVRHVGATSRGQLDPESLQTTVARDRADGHVPVLVVATVGSTAAGTIDSIEHLATVAEQESLWLHVDAAWGGAPAIFVPEMRPAIGPIDRADSVTVDAHKWLSVSMAAGIFLTRDRDILEQTFRVETGYMPSSETLWAAGDPYARSMQWTRRFIGLKLYMSLAVAGWGGYRSAVTRMIRMGQVLRQALAAAGWQAINDSVLPVTCFVDATHADGATGPYLRAVADSVNRSGLAWISTVRLGGTADALRACITNYRTGPDEVGVLIGALESARDEVSAARRSDGPEGDGREADDA